MPHSLLCEVECFVRSCRAAFRLRTKNEKREWNRSSSELITFAVALIFSLVLLHLSLSRPNILSPFWPQQEMKRMMMMIIMASLTPYAPFNDQCSAPKSDKNSPHWVSNTFCMGYFTTEEDYKTITFKSPTEPIWMIDQSYYYSLETMITWKLIPGGAINKPCW